MARAGFDPAESIRLWVNMSKAGGRQPPEFLSTHPAPETRISDLQNRLAAATSLYDAARASGKHPRCAPPTR
jgi:predicted Zn-dependent protease